MATSLALDKISLCICVCAQKLFGFQAVLQVISPVAGAVGPSLRADEQGSFSPQVREDSSASFLRHDATITITTTDKRVGLKRVNM